MALLEGEELGSVGVGVSIACRGCTGVAADRVRRKVRGRTTPKYFIVYGGGLKIQTSVSSQAGQTTMKPAGKRVREAGWQSKGKGRWSEEANGVDTTA